MDKRKRRRGPLAAVSGRHGAGVDGMVLAVVAAALVVRAKRAEVVALVWGM